MYQKIEDLVKQKKISWYRLSKDTGIPEGTFSKWKHGHYNPSFKLLVKLANYFGVKLDYFI